MISRFSQEYYLSLTENFEAMTERTWQKVANAVWLE